MREKARAAHASHPCSAKSEQCCPLDTASVDEIARVLPLGVFDEVTPLLGNHVRSFLQRVYGEDAWLREVEDGLGRQMRFFVREKPHVLFQDVYIIAEVIMNKLDRVFVKHLLDVFGLTGRGDLLLSVAADVDCLAQTRTCLFHSIQLSAREVHRCVVSVERICRRLAHAEKEAGRFFDFLVEVKRKTLVRGEKRTYVNANQILYSFSSGKDRRTDSRIMIRRKNTVFCVFFRLIRLSVLLSLSELKEQRI